jgi:hypothetical protein
MFPKMVVVVLTSFRTCRPPLDAVSTPLLAVKNCMYSPNVDDAIYLPRLVLCAAAMPAQVMFRFIPAPTSFLSVYQAVIICIRASPGTTCDFEYRHVGS